MPLRPNDPRQGRALSRRLKRMAKLKSASLNLMGKSVLSLRSTTTLTHWTMKRILSHQQQLPRQTDLIKREEAHQTGRSSQPQYHLQGQMKGGVQPRSRTSTLPNLRLQLTILDQLPSYSSRYHRRTLYLFTTRTKAGSHCRCSQMLTSSFIVSLARHYSKKKQWSRCLKTNSIKNV